MAQKCRYERCFCDSDGEDYCGPHCNEAAFRDEKPPSCECGHIDCEERTMRTGGVYTTGAWPARPVR